MEVIRPKSSRFVLGWRPRITNDPSMCLTESFAVRTTSCRSKQVAGVQSGRRRPESPVWDGPAWRAPRIGGWRDGTAAS